MTEENTTHELFVKKNDYGYQESRWIPCWFEYHAGKRVFVSFKTAAGHWIRDRGFGEARVRER